MNVDVDEKGSLTERGSRTNVPVAIPLGYIHSISWRRRQRRLPRGNTGPRLQGRFGSSVRINPRGDRHRLPPSGQSILSVPVPNRLRQSLVYGGQFRSDGSRRGGMTVWRQALPKPGPLNPLPEHPAIFGRMSPPESSICSKRVGGAAPSPSISPWPSTAEREPRWPQNQELAINPSSAISSVSSRT